ncbi:tetratricopeptide repeat protein, partial [Streptomyces hydrogenans]
PATARDLYADVITDSARVLGPDHPETLTSRHNHAYCTGRVGDPATAHGLYADVVTGRTRVLGPDHPDTLASRKQFHHWAKEAAGA